MDFVDDFEQDSGMESSPLYGDDSSKDDTPERKPEDLGLPKEVRETVKYYAFIITQLLCENYLLLTLLYYKCLVGEITKFMSN